MSVQYHPVQREAFGTNKVLGEYAAAQTDLLLVAGVPGKRHVIDYLIVSFAGTGTFLLAEGMTTVFGKLHMVAGSTVVIPNPDIRFGIGKGIAVTTTGIVSQTIWIEYHTE